VHEHWLSEQEAEWARLAGQESSPSTTEEQADRWLKGHGFGPVFHGTGHHEGPEGTEDTLVVWGQRQLDEGRLFLTPAWLDLYFYFGRDHKFLRVGAHVQRSPLAD
jgi:hypothetical protein